MTLKVLNPNKVCFVPRSLHLGGERIWHPATIIKGKGRGKILGFPTLNLRPESDFRLEEGVFTCLVKLKGKIYQGLLYFGPSLTFGEKRVRLEVYLLNFDKEAKIGNVFFKVGKFLRKGKKFPSPQELGKQIKKDIDEVALNSLK